jgi:Ni,Fe-hydrogenase I cytochrome b subunit
LSTILTMGLLGFWFRTIPHLRGYSLFSFVSGIVVLICGGLAAYTGATHSPILGLMERITIGGFLQWLFVMAWKLHATHALAVSPAVTLC